MFTLLKVVTSIVVLILTVLLFCFLAVTSWSLLAKIALAVIWFILINLLFIALAYWQFKSRQNGDEK
ncbi:hypothetical protein [Eupransor demetentiae]|uniref:Cytochrome oxidase subunit II transmembrane region profile domain-containing protein n=1 Tax=Eupransor demetentiae TaxID=3109584 RepID=A0ABP0EMQ6_9LACO|nr:hypothetical protein R54876_GBNLAHCA_00132 [Lactobacillaceae bacterium LMG 33000]